jgi:hypothetical protein
MNVRIIEKQRFRPPKQGDFSDNSLCKTNKIRKDLFAHTLNRHPEPRIHEA